MTNKNEYGCLMAMPTTEAAKIILTIGKKLVNDSTLYIDPIEEYGRDNEPHVTIRYGFITDLTETDIHDIYSDTKDFLVYINGISIFECELYDVVKYDIQKSGKIMELNKRCNKYPFENLHGEYYPHMTIAYVRKGTFPNKSTIIQKIPIVMSFIKYSGIDGKKSSFKL